MSTTILRSGTHVARKKHKCFWCGGEIKTLTKYHSSVQVYDGHFIDIKSHTCCNELFNIFWNNYGWDDTDGMSSTDFCEQAWELVHPDQYEDAPFGFILDKVKERFGIKPTFGWEKE